MIASVSLIAIIKDIISSENKSEVTHLVRKSTQSSNVHARETRLPVSRPLAIGEMTKEQINIEIQKGMDDFKAGRVISVDEVEAGMKALYGI